MKRANKKVRTANLTVLFFLFFAVNQSARADFVFGEAANLGAAINSPMNDVGPGLAGDGLSLVFGRYQSDWSGVPELWVAQRTTPDNPWDDAVNAGQWGDPIGTISRITDAVGGLVWGWGTTDGLEAYWEDESPDSSDLWVMERETVDADWEPPQNLGPTVNSSSGDYSFCVSADGLVLYFGSDRPGGYGSWDLYVTTRATRSDPWGEPINLGSAVNSSSWEYQPSLSADGLLLFFASGRPGGLGPDDIYMARRASPSDPWGQAVNLGPTVNTSADDWTPYLSADGSTLYFTSTRSGGYGSGDLWQAAILPIVDFNGDGSVDCIDICDLVDHWGTDNPLYDIGPTPFGDGVINAQDLLVLAEHIVADADDPNDVE